VWLRRPSQLSFLGHSVLDFVDFACNFFTDNCFTCLSLFDASHTSVGLLLAVADNSSQQRMECYNQQGAEQVHDQYAALFPVPWRDFLINNHLSASVHSSSVFYARVRLVVCCWTIKNSKYCTLCCNWGRTATESYVHLHILNLSSLVVCHSTHTEQRSESQFLSVHHAGNAPI